MKCPHGCPSDRVVYKCDLCGEVRCSNPGSGSSYQACPGGNNDRGAANSGGLCKACRKGRYRKL